MHDTYARAEKIKEIAMGVATREGKGCVEEIDFATGYAEPGCTDPECGVIALGNWNDITKWDEDTRESTTLDNVMSRLARIFETMGIKLEWSDEWSECHECSRIVRTSPDCYSWTGSYYIDEGSLTCVECLQGSAEDYLEGLECNPESCNAIDGIHPSHYDYILIEDHFEHGFHRGQDASPANIAKLLEKVGCTRYLFNLDSKGQFDIRFSVWLHIDDKASLEAAKHAMETGETDGPSVSGTAKRGLEEASRQQSELRGPGIKYSKVDTSTGTAETRLVSEEEFIGGIKD